MADCHVALLRGVNVGGKNLLPMKTLTAIFEDVGCASVRTYIQSGNVVFESPGVAPATIEAAIYERCGIKSPVVMRNLAQMRAVVEGNPFLYSGEDEKALFVHFLGSEPPADRLATLDPQRGRPDRYQVIGREIFLSIATSAATTKLTNPYFESRLGTTSTARNWRTVMKLYEMLRDG